MPLENLKIYFEIAESLATVLGILMAGLWAFRLYWRQRENHAHIEFTADIEFLKKVDDCWIVEVLAFVENKGKVQHRVFTFDFDLAALNTGDKINNSEKHGGQVEFPNILVKGSFLPSRYKYFFLEPGIKGKYSFITQVPVNSELVILHSWFQYNDGKHSHSAERTKAVPK